MIARQCARWPGAGRDVRGVCGDLHVLHAVDVLDGKSDGRVVSQHDTVRVDPTVMERA